MGILQGAVIRACGNYSFIDSGLTYCEDLATQDICRSAPS